MSDPAIEIINTVSDALAAWFTPPGTDEVPPIRFFAGDGPALAAWDSHASGGCDQPFVWVLAQRRYRSQEFPHPTIDATPCGLTKVLALQVGVGRCVDTSEIPKWATYQAEAELSLADSFRIEQALCLSAQRLTADGFSVATDTLIPFGPEGGVVAWTAVIYVSM